MLGRQGSCCWFGHGDTSLGCKVQCALWGVFSWQEGSLEGAVCVLLMSWMKPGLWRSAGRVHFISSRSEKSPCSVVLPWRTGVPPNRGALLQGTVSVTALTAKQLSPNEDLVVIELHSRSVSLRRWEVWSLMDKLGEMLLRASFQISVWFSFRLGLKCVKELWVALWCKFGHFWALGA